MKRRYWYDLAEQQRLLFESEWYMSDWYKRVLSEIKVYPKSPLIGVETLILFVRIYYMCYFNKERQL